MAFLKRLSDSLWDYVSPSKPSLPTPKTGAINTTGLTPANKTSIEHVVKHAQSMSPSEKIKGWPVQTPTSSLAGTKRRRSSDASSSLVAGRPIKQPKLKSADMEDMRSLRKSLDVDGDSVMGEEYDDEDEEEDMLIKSEVGSTMRTPANKYRGLGSPLFGQYSRNDSPMSAGNTTVLEDKLHDTPPKFQHVDAEAWLTEQNYSTAQLRAKGWDDDYITLLQKFFLRGYEPLLPRYMKFEYRFWPDGFFEKEDDAFIGSMRGDQFKASVALKKLFDIGGYVRDACYMSEENLRHDASPEGEVSRLFNAYLRWAEADAELFPKTAMPVLTQVYEPAGTDGVYIKALAKAQCEELAQRWKDEFQVSPSVEFSPGSKFSDGTMLSYELPTLYALVACRCRVWISSYRADTEEMGGMIALDFEDKDTDVYNALTLAMLACHVRNIEARVAQDTGRGFKQPGSGGEDGDPDA